MGNLIHKIKKPLFGVLSALLLVTAPMSALAQETPKKSENKKKAKEELPSLNIFSESAVLYDAKLNKIVYKKNEKEKIPTASLAKLMTLFIASEQLSLGNIKKEDKVEISKKAWQTGGSRMFLEVGREVPFNELFKGVAVVSGNDAAVAMAEHIDGSTEKFVKRMNKKAKELGMKNTEFHSVNGLPDGDVTDTSTAEDLAKMTIAYLKAYPGNLSIHSMKEYAFDTGRDVITQKNRNPLLNDYEGADGLKTGFVDNTYNLIGTAQRDGVRLIFVSMKAPSSKERAKDAKTILDFGFNQYGKYQLAKKGEKISVLPVYKAKDAKKTDIVIKNDAEVVLHSSQLKNKEIKKKIKLPNYVNASKGLKQGDKVGTIDYYADGKKVFRVDLTINQDLESATWWEKGLDSLIISGRWVIDLF